MWMSTSIATMIAMMIAVLTFDRSLRLLDEDEPFEVVYFFALLFCRGQT